MRLFAGAWRVEERMEHILTSEAVTRGHPDKVCDQIADALLDAVLAEDPEARAACEAAVWENRVWLFGELTAKQVMDYEAVFREVLRDIGYDRPELGLDAETCDIEVHFHPQSPDIARGVSHRAAEDTGAGDQGIMAGYACRETAERMPLPITLANRLAKRLEAVRQEGILPWLRPDGKAQVSVAYRDGVPVGITTVVLSAQHDPDITVDDLREALRQEVVLPVLPAELVRGGSSPAAPPLTAALRDENRWRTPTAAPPATAAVPSLARTPPRRTAPELTWPGIWPRTSWRQGLRTAARCSWPMPSAWRTPSA